jgi:hypothetical protein
MPRVATRHSRTTVDSSSATRPRVPCLAEGEPSVPAPRDPSAARFLFSGRSVKSPGPGVGARVIAGRARSRSPEGSGPRGPACACPADRSGPGDVRGQLRSVDTAHCRLGCQPSHIPGRRDACPGRRRQTLNESCDLARSASRKARGVRHRHCPDRAGAADHGAGCSVGRGGVAARHSRGDRCGERAHPGRSATTDGADDHGVGVHRLAEGG